MMTVAEGFSRPEVTMIHLGLLENMLQSGILTEALSASTKSALSAFILW